MGDMYRFNQDSRFEIRYLRIILQRSPKEESVPGNDGDEHLEDAPSKENHREGLEIEDDIGSEDGHFDKPQAYNGRKREVSGRRAHFIGCVRHVTATGDRVSYFSKTEAQGHTDSRDGTSSYRGKKHNSPRNHVESNGRKGSLVLLRDGRLSQKEIKRMVRKAEEFADDNDKLADKLETDEKGKIEAVQLSIKEQVEVMVVVMTRQMTMMNMVSFRSFSYIDKRLE
ncbi:hypothetical protein Tco_0716233 [Tanacetum coccineum]